MKTFKQFIDESLKQSLDEMMTTYSTPDKPGFSSLADDRGPVAGRSPKMFFLSRKFAKKYDNGNPIEKIWLDSLK